MKKKKMRIPLPKQFSDICKAVAELEAAYPGRKFTPDGHMVGSIGAVVAAKALDLKLHSTSHSNHVATDADGKEVQIKMTASKKIDLRSNCERLVVLKVVSPKEAEIVYDGPGEPVWNVADKKGSNGQRSVTFTKLYKLKENL